MQALSTALSTTLGPSAPAPLCACRNCVNTPMLAVQPGHATHHRRVCDGGLRAARAHRQGAAERTPECGAAEQRQAAQGCDGPGVCPTRRSPVHAGACKALTTAHGHVSASQVLTTAPDLRPPRRSRRMRSSSLRTRRPCVTCSRPSSTRCDLVPVPRHACARMQVLTTAPRAPSPHR